jgi:hypothetical protein
MKGSTYERKEVKKWYRGRDRAPFLEYPLAQLGEIWIQFSASVKALEASPLLR